MAPQSHEAAVSESPYRWTRTAALISGATSGSAAPLNVFANAGELGRRDAALSCQRDREAVAAAIEEKVDKVLARWLLDLDETARVEALPPLVKRDAALPANRKLAHDRRGDVT